MSKQYHLSIVQSTYNELIIKATDSPDNVDIMVIGEVPSGAFPRKMQVGGATKFKTIFDRLDKWLKPAKCNRHKYFVQEESPKTVSAWLRPREQETRFQQLETLKRSLMYVLSSNEIICPDDITIDKKGNYKNGNAPWISLLENDKGLTLPTKRVLTRLLKAMEAEGIAKGQQASEANNKKCYHSKTNVISASMFDSKELRTHFSNIIQELMAHDSDQFEALRIYQSEQMQELVENIRKEKSFYTKTLENAYAPRLNYFKKYPFNDYPYKEYAYHARKAIMEDRYISITYVYDGTNVVFEAFPVALMYLDHGLYLVALLSKDVQEPMFHDTITKAHTSRLIRITYITELELLEKKASKLNNVEGLEAALEYVESLHNPLTLDVESETAYIRIPKDIANHFANDYVEILPKQKRYNGSRYSELTRDGSIIVTSEFTQPKEISHKLMGWDPIPEVLEPASLRQFMLDILRTGLNSYGIKHDEG